MLFVQNITSVIWNNWFHSNIREIVFIIFFIVILLNSKKAWYVVLKHGYKILSVVCRKFITRNVTENCLFLFVQGAWRNINRIVRRISLKTQKYHLTFYTFWIILSFSEHLSNVMNVKRNLNYIDDSIAMLNWTF